MSYSVNDKVNRLRALDAQVKHLEQIIKRGEHVGAGLEVTLSVGPQRGVDPDLVLQVSNDTSELLEILRSSLLKSREQNAALLRSEMKEIEQFLEADRPSAQRPAG